MPRIKNWKRVDKFGENTEVEWVHRPTGLRVSLEELPEEEEEDESWSPEYGGVRSGANWVVTIGGADPFGKSYLGKNEGYDAATSFLRDNPDLEPALPEQWDPTGVAEEVGRESVLAGWNLEDGYVAVYYDETYVVERDGDRETYQTRFESIHRAAEVLGVED